MPYPDGLAGDLGAASARQLFFLFRQPSIATAAIMALIEGAPRAVAPRGAVAAEGGHDDVAVARAESPMTALAAEPGTNTPCRAESPTTALRAESPMTAAPSHGWADLANPTQQPAAPPGTT